MVAFRIAENALRRQLRDRLAVAVGLLAPIVLTLLAVTALGRLTDSFDARFVVVDQGSGVIGDLLVRGVQADARTAKVIDIGHGRSVAAAHAEVARGDATAAFVIPADFSRALARNDPSPIRLRLDPADPVGSQFARAVAEQFVSRLSANQLATAVALESAAASGRPLPVTPNDLAILASREPLALELDDELLEGQGSRSLAAFFAPSMAVVGLLVIVQMAARSLMEERVQGTFRRLRSLGVSLRQVLVGKALAGVCVGMTTMGLTLTVAGLATGARWGNPLYASAMCLATVVAFLALASLITVISPTEEAASGLGILTGTFLALVGGNFLPLSQARGPLVHLSALTPNGWALRGFSELQAGGAGVADLLPAFAVLGLFTLVCGLPALWLARWKLT